MALLSGPAPEAATATPNAFTAYYQGVYDQSRADLAAQPANVVQIGAPPPSGSGPVLLLLAVLAAALVVLK